MSSELQQPENDQEEREPPALTVEGDVGPGSVVGSGRVEAGHIAGRDIYHIVLSSPLLLTGAAMVLLLIFGGAILWLATREQPAPKPAPIPTATRLPGPPADVLIAELDARHANDSGVEIVNRLESDLKSKLRESDLGAVNVKVIRLTVSTEDEARLLAQEQQSKVVIWGWYDSLGISIRIFLAGASQTGAGVAGTGELPLNLAGQPDAQLAFFVKQELPDDVSFLSLFVIGRLFYLNDEYQAGHRAFDAAMAALRDVSDEVKLENEALLHFFTARELDASGSDDVTSIVCEYAKAIEQDPDFAEAYTNLGVALARRAYLIVPDRVFDVPLSEEATACLGEIGLSWDYYVEPAMVDLFDKALELQPDLTLAEYNRLGLEWRRGTTGEFPEQDKTLIPGLEAIAARDPSIYGADILLGNAAFDRGDFEAAARWFSAGLDTAPDSTALHFNLGQVYMKRGEHDQAEAEFQNVLALDPDDAEARLALANLAVQRGQTDAAQAHLDALLPVSADSYRGNADAMAALLRSRLDFEAGRYDATMTTLVEVAKLPCCSEKMSPPVIYWGSFETFLLGTLYALQENPMAARDTLSGIEPDLRGDTYSTFSKNYALAYNLSSVVAWLDLVAQCERPWYEAWGVDSKACLPADLAERIRALYDRLQERLEDRLYYRRAFAFPDLGLACPQVYTYAAGAGDWRFDTTILYKLVGPERETAQARRLARFDGRLWVRELEPEISYIDRLYVRVIDGDGRVYTLQAAHPALAQSDGEYLVLHPGDGALLTFDGYGAVPAPREAWVVAEGYYTPLPAPGGD